LKTKHVELWKCDVCQRWFPTSQIRKVPHDAIQYAGSNYLLSSDPPGDFSRWSVDNIDLGAGFIDKESMGTNGDFRLKVQESVSGTPPLMGTTLLYPASTFRGSLLLTPWMYGMAQFSSWDHLCFGMSVGPHEDAPTPLEVSVGCVDINAGITLPNCTFYYTNTDIRGATTVWFTVKMADLPYAFGDVGLVLYVKTQAPTDKWWAQNAFLMKNVDNPASKPFYPTGGAAVSFDPAQGTVVDILKDQWTRMAVYACPKDADEVLLRRRTPGRRENRMIPPYEERET
jgi:hypothetical protein